MESILQQKPIKNLQFENKYSGILEGSSSKILVADYYLALLNALDF